MERINFKNGIYHIFIDNELIILDTIADKFFFFEKKESLLIKKIISSNKKSYINEKLQDFSDRFLINGSSDQKLNECYNINGVDSHSWRDVKFYLKSTVYKISFKDKFLILVLINIIFNIKSLSLRIKIFQYLKNKKTTKKKENDDFVISSNIFIHRLLKFLPYQAKCLEHSFILGLYLIINGYDCTINIGIQKYNFLSHAWVEIDDSVVGDNPNLSVSIAKILKI